MRLRHGWFTIPFWLVFENIVLKNGLAMRLRHGWFTIPFWLVFENITSGKIVIRAVSTERGKRFPSGAPRALREHQKKLYEELPLKSIWIVEAALRTNLSEYGNGIFSLKNEIHLQNLSSIIISLLAP